MDQISASGQKGVGARYGATYRSELLRVLLHSLRVQHLPVVLAYVQVLGLVLGQDDLLLVVPQLEVCDVVLLDLGHVFAAGPLLLPLLQLLLELLGRLLGLAREVLGADLAAQDAGLGPVAHLDAQRHLGEDELDLLATLHGAERLDLQLAQHVGGGLEVALLLLDVGQDLGDAGALHLDEDLALGHDAQRLDDGQLRLQVWGLAEEAHDGLHHAGDGLLELAVFLGQDEGLVAEELPVAGIFAECDDGDEDSGGGCEVGRLCGFCFLAVSFCAGGEKRGIGGREEEGDVTPNHLSLLT